MAFAPAETPLPPLELASRIGGAYGDYRTIGAAHRRHIDGLLPAEWSFDGKAVLDFGCGTGRTLTSYAPETGRAEFWGCDIHVPSIEWAQENLSPPFSFFSCQESPPLDQPDARFDLIYAMSVFTHITDEWSAWLTEMHRVLRTGGIAVVSVLGPAMAQTIIGRDWDPRIGMAIVDLHKGWEIGGPSVLLSEWWVEEHWGRGFEILQVAPFAGAEGQGGHDFVAMRKREVAVTAADFERVEIGDAREHEAALANVELLLAQTRQLGDHMRHESSDHERREAALAAERARLAEELAEMRASTGGRGRLSRWLSP